MIDIKQLKANKQYEDEHFIYKLKPARQGGIFGSPRKDGKEKKIKYPTRIQITAKESLKKLINE